MFRQLVQSSVRAVRPRLFSIFQQEARGFSVLAAKKKDATQGPFANLYQEQPKEIKPAKQTEKIWTGNSAASYVAYGMCESIMIFPITPSSTMGDAVDAYAAAGLKNCLGNHVKVVQMQSEGGAAGALHGSCSSGALSATFTCSQGLLLFIPNLYLLAGELTPAAFHVSARTVSKHALSIFGDHSDVMSVRQTGVSMLSSTNQQEVHDMAVVAHVASLNGSIPVMHFFDGFRTSHTSSDVQALDYDSLRTLMPMQKITENLHEKALNSTRPVHRGTGQRTDIFFQNTIAGRGHFLRMPNVIQDAMDQVATLTGRQYNIMEYFGHPEAEKVMVLMGSAVKSVHATLRALPQDEKIGVINVRVFRPWDSQRFLAALPATTKSIAVMDRTNEDGAFNPLYLDVVATLQQAGKSGQIQTVNGCYGLASREFAPGHIKAVYDFLDKPDKNYFTVNIDDDVYHTNIPDPGLLDIDAPTDHNSLLWGVGGDGIVGLSSQLLAIVHGEKKKQGGSYHGQVYTIYDAHKEGGVTCSHLRFSETPIEKEYLIEKAHFQSIGHRSYLSIFGHKVAEKSLPNGTILVNSPWSKPEEFEEHVNQGVLRLFAEKDLNIYCVDATAVARKAGMAKRGAVGMGVGFMNCSGIVEAEEGTNLLKADAAKRFKRKGEAVVKKNVGMMEDAVRAIYQIQYDNAKWRAFPEFVGRPRAETPPEPLTASAEEYCDKIMHPMLEFEAENLPVSMMIPGGNQAIGSTEFEKRGMATQIPVWTADKCIQCNMCAIVCPHSVIRPFTLNDEETDRVPADYDVLPIKLPPQQRGKVSATNFTIQVSSYDCTGCEHCVQTCPTDALHMVDLTPELLEKGSSDWEFSLALTDRGSEFDPKTIKGSQFQTPQFQFNGACSGCGETSIVKLLSQMYGPQLVLANSSGCSSVWSGLAGFSPMSKDQRGYGPAWGRSLFEDTAEYGFGLMVGMKQRRRGLGQAIEGVLATDEAPEGFKQSLEGWVATRETFEANHPFSCAIEATLGSQTAEGKSEEYAWQLDQVKFNADCLRPQQHWIIGGDGWAYDIGFGGLTHVLGLNENINILVLDTECYANTGSQSSSATQVSAVHKFAMHGKNTKKKDLAKIAMSFDNVYVAQVCLGANQGQSVLAIEEAVSHPGPSIIVAFTPCVDWGLQPNEMMKNAKGAVDVGYWSLFRYDPKKGKEALTLDATPKPEEDMLAFMLEQNRFTQLVRDDPEKAETMHTKLGRVVQDDIQKIAGAASAVTLPAGKSNPSLNRSMARESVMKQKQQARAVGSTSTAGAPRGFSTRVSRPTLAPAPADAAMAMAPVIAEEDGKIEGRPRDVYVNRPRPQWNALKCTQCLECVTACDQSALFPAWLPQEKVDNSPHELNVAPAADMPGTAFTFFISDKCNGCQDCAIRCDELFYGGCLEMVEDGERAYEQHDLGVIAALGGTPNWDADKCTACGKCEAACPTGAITPFTGISEAKLQNARFPIPQTTAVDGRTNFILGVNPDICTSCQECVAVCRDELDTAHGENAALAMTWDFTEKKDIAAKENYLRTASTNYQQNEVIVSRMLAIDEQTGRDVGELVFYNPELARVAESGLFMIIMSHADGERIPLTYCDWDAVNGTVTMVVQNLGVGSAKIIDVEEGSVLETVVGPLGMKTHVTSYDKDVDGKVVIMAGGVGLAAAFPVIRAFKQGRCDGTWEPGWQEGGKNYVVSLLGFRHSGLVWYADESEEWSDEMIIMTDDGSAGKKGFVHLGLQEMIDNGEKIAEVWVCGPPPMMDAVVNTTRKYDLKTTVSLAPHMVDGTGMCGACRVEVAGERRFACIHGPEFDGLKLNWDVFKSRHRQYLPNQEDAKMILKEEKINSTLPAHVRVAMREQPGEIRRENWHEVTLGYTPEEAMAEAKRCIQCHNPTCVVSKLNPKAGCPVQVDIPGFIKQIAKGNFVAAAEVIKRTNPVGAICGRVCPQEDQCEATCIFAAEGEIQEPIAIGRLERFCSDYARKFAGAQVPIYPEKTGKTVAVVGTGPAGLAAAGELAQAGHDVTMLEALHKVGGVLRYGIPDFRLPKEIIDYDVGQLERIGVKIAVNHPVGPLKSVPKMVKRNGGEFDAVFLGVGAGAPIFLGIPGENANGVISANEFLTRIVLMKANEKQADTPCLGDDLSNRNRVIVVGAGNTAMDVSRSAMRMVSKRGGTVTMVYRRAMTESPSREEEVHHASDEGVQFVELTKPERCIVGDDGWLTGLECSRMELLESRGGAMEGSRITKRLRRDVRPMPDSMHVIPCDIVIPAIGTGSNEVLTRSFPELMLNKKGYILADEFGYTSYEGVFAGGDIVSGAATVIEAAGMGRVAAQNMNEYLKNGQWSDSAPKVAQFAKLRAA